MAFQIGDAHAIQFSDRSFDVVVSLRVLMHTPDWRQVIAEMCRVADQLVIVDYPSRLSFAALHAGARRSTNHRRHGCADLKPRRIEAAEARYRPEGH